MLREWILAVAQLCAVPGARYMGYSPSELVSAQASCHKYYVECVEKSKKDWNDAMPECVKAREVR